MINTYVALDLETTGIDPVKSEILEIGAVKVVDGNVVDTYGTLLNIDGDIPKQVVELTGITKSMTTTGIPERQAMDEICDFCKGYVLLGHNIRFDYSFLKAKSMKYKLQIPNDAVDTLKIARNKLKELESRSLSYLCEYFNIPPSVSHRAYEDAESAMKLYNIFQDMFGDEEELFKSFKLTYKPKKESPITAAQIRYLTDLLNYHGLSVDNINELTKSDASRKIDSIIREYGRIERGFR